MIIMIMTVKKRLIHFKKNKNNKNNKSDKNNIKKHQNESLNKFMNQNQSQQKESSVTNSSVTQSNSGLMKQNNNNNEVKDDNDNEEEEEEKRKKEKIRLKLAQTGGRGSILRKKSFQDSVLEIAMAGHGQANQHQDSSNSRRQSNALKKKLSMIETTNRNILAQQNELKVIAFNLFRPFGLEIGRESMKILKVIPKGQGHKLLIKKKWIVIKVGREKVSNMDEFVNAIAKRRNKGDAEVMIHFNCESDSNEGGTPKTPTNPASTDPTSTTSTDVAVLKHVSSLTPDVIRVSSPHSIKNSSLNNKTSYTSLSPNKSLANKSLANMSLLDAAIERGTQAPLIKRASSTHEGGKLSDPHEYADNGYNPGVLV